MRPLLVAVLLGGLVGCVRFDRDGDGVSARNDCDDDDPNAFPGGEELCDGVDNDCDGLIDEGFAMDALDWYGDGDGDGYGDPEDHALACEQPPSFVSDHTDCDDRSAVSHPGATERCDGLDNDCDGDVDESPSADDPGAVDALEWYVDEDGDGYGDPAQSRLSCAQPTGAVADNTDCDDADASIFPGADEYCNGVDDDCDQVIDEDDAVDAPTWYADEDEDGYGDPLHTTRACALPDGYRADNTDCDDTADDVFPGAKEYCDGVDHDCDGGIDEDSSVDALTWHPDADGDGYGDPASQTQACHQPDDYVSDDTDCDDTSKEIFPGADEYCNLVDDNCDGRLDENDAVDVTTWHADADRDGYGASTVASVQCYPPGRDFVSDDTDCDDGDLSIHPGADEYCDGADNNCDGNIDESSAVDASTWYEDGDDDGWGDSSSIMIACDEPSGFVDNDDDCDDNDPSNVPTAYYADQDLDGYGEEHATASYDCGPPSVNMSTTHDDCDDRDSTVHPGATESFNRVDDDCDGSVDDIQLADADASWWGDRGEQAGSVVCSSRDIDKDGVNDVFIGAPGYDDAVGDEGAGRVFADPLGSGGVSTTVTGGDTGDELGYAAALVGDTNLDTWDDLLVGAPGTDTDSGAVLLYHGPTTAATPSLGADVLLSSVDAGARAGQAVGVPGDIDGDGYADLLIGGPDANSGDGMAWFVMGPVTSNMHLSNADTILYGESGVGAGTDLDGVGDLDADGVDDIIIGTGEFDSTGVAGSDRVSSCAYVVFGVVSGLPGSSISLEDADVILEEESELDACGVRVVGGGDLTGDGLNDVVVAAPDNHGSAGRVYIISGKTIGASSTVALGSAIATIDGQVLGDELGSDLALVPDMDGDHVAELLVGASQTAASDAGMAYLFLGPLTGSVGFDPAATFAGTYSGDAAGAAVGLLDDQNGDGSPEILVGAPSASGGTTGIGAGYLVLSPDPSAW